MNKLISVICHPKCLNVKEHRHTSIHISHIYNIQVLYFILNVSNSHNDCFFNKVFKGIQITFISPKEWVKDKRTSIQLIKE